MEEKLEQIIKHYGYSNQLKKLSEELYEFQEAVITYELDWQSTDTTQRMIKADQKHILEEFADVMVLMEQFRLAYEIDNDEVIKIMKQKIDRQINRIKQEG